MKNARLRLSMLGCIAVVCWLCRVANADDVQLKVTPDTVTKGSTQPVQLTWPTTVGAHENGMANTTKVSVGGREPIAIEKGSATQQSVIVVLPPLEITGVADIRVLDAKDQLIAVGTLHYVNAPETTSRTVDQGNVRVLILYVILLVLFPFLLMWTDILKAYRFAQDTRTLLMEKFTPDKVTLDELKLLLADVDTSPPGIPGLARATLAFTLLLVIGIMLFHVLVLSGHDIPSGADKLLTLLGTALTSVIAFYFGSKAANENSQQAAATGTQRGAGTQKPISNIVTPVPNHAKVGDEVQLSGGGFGATPGRVAFGAESASVVSWSDNAVTARVPGGVSGEVQITVTPLGASPITSAPGTFLIDP
jgi:hypothetical protein